MVKGLPANAGDSGLIPVKPVGPGARPCSGNKGSYHNKKPAR